MKIKSYNANPDVIKKQFKEYKDGKGSQIVHEASRILMEHSVLPEALQRGKNVTIQTLGWPDYVERLAAKAKEFNYEVHIIHVNVDDISTAIERNLQRYKRTKRFFDPYFTYEIKNISPVDIWNLPESFKNNNNIDKITVYDNNGKEPILKKILK